jgi:hypothetical protein
LDNPSYESNKGTNWWTTKDHKAVYFNYARDLLFELLNKKSFKGDEIFQKLEKSNESFAITSITFYEIVSFFMSSGRQVPPINLLQVYGFSKEDGQKAAELELELQKKEDKKIMVTEFDNSCSCYE